MCFSKNMEKYTDLRIDIERLRKDLQELSKIGYDPETRGINRIGLSKADYEGRLWLMEQFKSLGLKPYMDGACNVICRYGDSDKPAVMMGSHLDTVPNGGIFDGSLGVMSAYECMRVIKENNIKLSHPIEVIATSEEEGRFGGMFGVQALCGKVSPDWLESVKDNNGIALKDELINLGLDPMEALNAYRDPRQIKAFLELHIEQGPVLDSMHRSIGVVEGISGVFDWSVRLIGEANHSGTTPMNARKDAFLALSDFAHEFSRIISEDGSEDSRLTIGKIELKPGFSHVVPGEVVFTLNGRDPSEEVMHNLANSCRKVLSSIARETQLMFEYEEKSWLSPTDCSKSIAKVFESNAKKLGYDPHRMPSGAGHDAQFMSEVTDAGIIFVPSVRGISHSPKEWTNWPDIEKGTNVLLHSCLQLAK